MNNQIWFYNFYNYCVSEFRAEYSNLELKSHTQIYIQNYIHESKFQIWAQNWFVETGYQNLGVVRDTLMWVQIILNPHSVKFGYVMVTEFNRKPKSAFKSG